MDDVDDIVEVFNATSKRSASVSVSDDCAPSTSKVARLRSLEEDEVIILDDEAPSPSRRRDSEPSPMRRRESASHEESASSSMIIGGFAERRCHEARQVELRAEDAEAAIVSQWSVCVGTGTTAELQKRIDTLLSQQEAARKRSEKAFRGRLEVSRQSDNTKEKAEELSRVRYTTKDALADKNHTLKTEVKRLKHELETLHKKMSEDKQDYRDRIAAQSRSAAEKKRDQDRIIELTHQVEKLKDELDQVNGNKMKELTKTDNSLDSLVKMLAAEQNRSREERKTYQQRIDELTEKLAARENWLQLPAPLPPPPPSPAFLLPPPPVPPPPALFQLPPPGLVHPPLPLTTPPPSEIHRPSSRERSSTSNAAPVFPHLREKLPMIAHATNLFAPCSMKAQNVVAVGRAVDKLREAMEKHGMEHYLARCEHNRDIRVLCCGLCDKSRLHEKIYHHFTSPNHMEEVRKADSGVSAVALKHWLQLLKPLKPHRAPDDPITID